MLSCSNLMDYVYQLQSEAGSRRSVTDYVWSHFSLIAGRVLEMVFTPKPSADEITPKVTRRKKNHPAGNVEPHTNWIEREEETKPERF